MMRLSSGVRHTVRGSGGHGESDVTQGAAGLRGKGRRQGVIDVDEWRSVVLDTCRERPALLPHVAVEALRARDDATRLRLPDDERALCEVCALAHDIGKVDALRTTGTDVHPLDGAAFALACGEPGLAALIAHHSGARYEAALRGLTIPYPYEDSIVTQIVAVVDASTLQSGVVVPITERLRDIVDRYGAESSPARAMRAFWPELVSAVQVIDPSLL